MRQYLHPLPKRHVQKCLSCGVEFTSAHFDARFCGSRCNYAYLRISRFVGIPCAQCGTPVPRGRRLFCSDRCVYEHRQANRSVEHPGNWGRTPWNKGCRIVSQRPCDICGISFRPEGGQLQKGVGRFCSNLCKGAFMVSNPDRFPRGRRGRGGRRPDLGGVYFRSSWEANYARYLNHLVQVGDICRWEYEVDAFTLSSISYLPDFKVWVTSTKFEYHEVKGYMDSRSLNKIEAFRIERPDLPLVLVDKDAYHSIEHDVQTLIPGWEGR